MNTRSTYSARHSYSTRTPHLAPQTIAGGSLSMESLAGKPVIMLNVASR